MSTEYPSIPPVKLVFPPAGFGYNKDLPCVCGIYFAWSEGVVVYVGKSTDIYFRANPKNHPHIRPGDGLSYVEIEADELSFAECHYIAQCRPVRNFGGWKKIPGYAESMRAAELLKPRRGRYQPRTMEAAK